MTNKWLWDFFGLTASSWINGGPATCHWEAVAGAVVSSVVGGMMSDGGDGGGGAFDVAAASAAQTNADINLKNQKIYEENYLPVEKQVISEAGASGGAEDIARLQGEANADVMASYDQTRRTGLDALNSYGINPASPAYQSSLGSIDLAQAGERSRALTKARNDARDLGYGRRYQVASLGRNIPAQTSAGLSSVANQFGSLANNAYNRSRQEAQDRAYAAAPFADAAGKAVSQNWGRWFDNDKNSDFESGGGFAKGGLVALKRRAAKHLAKHLVKQYVHGGRVGFADGGMVDEETMKAAMQVDASESGPMRGPGSETSDSIPAVIDGQAPASLSTNEFVMNAGVSKMSGLEILDAINKAGLSRRNDAPEEAPEDIEYEDHRPGLNAMNRGGKVCRRGHGA